MHFIGIDNYLPLSDRRDGMDHLDAQAGWGGIHDLEYLRSNIEGGEQFDWFYASEADRTAQTRTPITDGAYAKPWVFRPKDIRAWWLNPHYDRLGGIEAATPTAWVPQSKPIRFTELGCPAVDRGPNQPNVFVDPKSAESALPHFSRGWQDAAIQRRYLAAAQAQKHVTVNEALDHLDGLVQLSVISSSLTAPPATPTDGDRYIVAASATSAWAGWDGSVTQFSGGAWLRVIPQTGWIAWDQAAGAIVIYDAIADWGQLPTGASSFTGLNDTPAGFTGQAGKTLQVNTGENALEFVTPAAGGAPSAGGPCDLQPVSETHRHSARQPVCVRQKYHGGGRHDHR